MHARLRRPARDGAVALHCAEAPPLAPPEKHPSSLASSQLAAHAAAVPTPAAGGLVLSHLLWEASCCLFPAALAAPRQAAVRATARTRLLPGAPSSGRARAQPILFFVMITLQKPSDTLIILTYFDAPTTRANWTETFLPALKRPLPTSRGGWRGLRWLWWWCLDSSYDYGHRGQREPRVRTRPRLIVWGSVDGSRFCTRSRI